MGEEEYEKIYEENKKFYWSIKYIICVILYNERIIFNGAGWKHLVFKNGRARPIHEQIKRFNLFRYIRLIITEGSLIKYDENIDNNSKAKFWRISKTIDRQVVVIVIRQIEDGPKHFFSIMN